jgi:hypothetical protein
MWFPIELIKYYHYILIFVNQKNQYIVYFYKQIFGRVYKLNLINRLYNKLPDSLNLTKVLDNLWEQYRTFLKPTQVGKFKRPVKRFDQICSVAYKKRWVPGNQFAGVTQI